MGTIVAPTYANIFMGKLKWRLFEPSCEKLLSLYRFIYDVDMKRNKSDNDLDSSNNPADNFHQTIKLMHKVSKSNITVLDNCHWYLYQTNN